MSEIVVFDLDMGERRQGFATNCTEEEIQVRLVRCCEEQCAAVLHTLAERGKELLYAHRILPRIGTAFHVETAILGVDEETCMLRS